MTTYYHLTPKSGNKKVGPVAVSTTSKDSCPDSCPLKANGCYADAGPLQLHWRKVSDGSRGLSIDEFCQALKKIPGGSLFRHNQAGDLPHISGVIDLVDLWKIVKAAKKLKGFTYTHHDLNISGNLAAIDTANKHGFTINVSANNAEEAAETYKKHKLPTVTLLPTGAPNVQYVNSVKVVACPAEKSDKVSCASCQLCADSDRDYIIGFRAHGTSKKKADIIASA